MEKEDDWSTENGKVTTHLETEKITSRDIFKLAKAILGWSTFLFILLAAAYVASPVLHVKDEMKEVWTFSSQALYGVITLILGLYFGGKIKDGQ